VAAWRIARSGVGERASAATPGRAARRGEHVEVGCQGTRLDDVVGDEWAIASLMIGDTSRARAPTVSIVGRSGRKSSSSVRMPVTAPAWG
jgi:hypothetical protein